jgi:hypothetical protein
VKNLSFTSKENSQRRTMKYIEGKNRLKKQKKRAV